MIYKVLFPFFRQLFKSSSTIQWMQTDLITAIIALVFYSIILYFVLPVAIAILINGVILYLIGMRTLVEIRRDQVEKYVFCSLISLAIIVSWLSGVETYLWKITWFFIMLALAVITFEAIESAVAYLDSLGKDTILARIKSFFYDLYDTAICIRHSLVK